MPYRRACLLTAAAVAFTLPAVPASPAAAARVSGDGPVGYAHGIRNALISAGRRFHGVPDILTGALTSSLNLHKGGLPLL
ncbi:hypothetical protein MF672_026450 [Actinomadura sp. ATCC 31491]|uniref:Uncharacterized protein n=1 Tax=Actinomadura luzonensis TaxID=2805427 RepID=A0ABT0FY70_9ACTN|nr:hypothetical protein [Actinomadura luzonensis]MCK2217302.1 hypothetical protein [Actinomadura luzonensis]